VIWQVLTGPGICRTDFRLSGDYFNPYDPGLPVFLHWFGRDT